MQFYAKESTYFLKKSKSSKNTTTSIGKTNKNGSDDNKNKIGEELDTMDRVEIAGFISDKGSGKIDDHEENDTNINYST